MLAARAIPASEIKKPATRSPDGWSVSTPTNTLSVAKLLKSTGSPPSGKRTATSKPNASGTVIVVPSPITREESPTPVLFTLSSPESETKLTLPATSSVTTTSVKLLIADRSVAVEKKKRSYAVFTGRLAGRISSCYNSRMKNLSEFNFEPLSEDRIVDLLAGHKDILTPLAAEQNQRLQGHTCHQCGSKLELTLSPRPFLPNRPLPRFVGKCPTCKVGGILIND